VVQARSTPPVRTARQVRHLTVAASRLPTTLASRLDVSDSLLDDAGVLSIAGTRAAALAGPDVVPRGAHFCGPGDPADDSRIACLRSG
jgi:hypothetical protein